MMYIIVLGQSVPTARFRIYGPPALSVRQYPAVKPEVKLNPKVWRKASFFSVILSKIIPPACLEGWVGFAFTPGLRADNFFHNFVQRSCP